MIMWGCYFFICYSFEWVSLEKELLGLFGVVKGIIRRIKYTNKIKKSLEVEGRARKRVSGNFFLVIIESVDVL